MGCHLLIAKSDAWSMTIIRTFVTWIFFSAFHANLLCEHLLNGVSSAFGINIPLLCHTTSIVSYPEIHRGNLFHTVLVCLVHVCIPSQGTPSPLAPSQAASTISCMVSRILTPPGRHHSGVSLSIRCFSKKAIAAAMFQCKPLFLFILGPIVLELIRNPIWQDSGGLASSFNFQSANPAF